MAGPVGRSAPGGAAAGRTVAAPPGRDPSLLLPAASALLLALAFPPLDLPLLAFAGLAPFALFVLGCGGDAAGRRRALLGSTVLGVVHFGLLLHWIPVAMARFSWLASPGYLAVVAGLTAVVAAAGSVLWASVHRVGLPLWVALPVAWTAGEWLRAHLPGGLSFPWLELGVSLSAYPRLAGVAEVVGTRGLGFWMATVSGLLAAAVSGVEDRRGGRARRVAAPAVAALLVTLLPMAWGVGRAERLRVIPAGRVAVVQPGVGTEARLDPVTGWAATRAALDRLLPELEGREAGLVVLPEVTLRARPGAASPPGATEYLVGMARRLGIPVIFGALGPASAGVGAEVGPGDAATPLHNSAYLATGAGLASFRYDKRRLVPGVERTPLGMEGLLPGAAGFEPGRAGPVVEVEGVRAGVLICYESLHADLARAYRRAGADLLLNLTHDGWFGGGPGEPRTVALAQHPAHLVLRAIETRMGVARAAATGVSLFVDPLGRVHRPTPMAVPAVRVHDPGTTEIRTAYVRWGDVAGTGSALLALLLAVTAMVRAPKGTPGAGT